jgi:hypothetical protein
VQGRFCFCCAVVFGIVLEVVVDRDVQLIVISYPDADCKCVQPDLLCVSTWPQQRADLPVPAHCARALHLSLAACSVPRLSGGRLRCQVSTHPGVQLLRRDVRGLQ